MSEYVFEFNLETGKEEKNTWGVYAVRYYKSDESIKVEIGDGYRHQLRIDAIHWNRILRIIKNNELDKDGIDAVVKGLMGHALPEEYTENLISAVKKERIKPVDIPKLVL